MPTRVVQEGLDDAKEGRVSGWVRRNLNPAERARFYSRINQIRNSSTDNPQWIKPYKSLRMYEVRVQPSGRIVRVLSDQLGDALVMLHPVIKKGKISGADEKMASDLRDALRKGKLDVREFPRA
jgi:phage-related protein